MRLTEEYRKTIKETLLKHFGGGSKFYLFGSRTDDNKRGGDIDLYIDADFSDITKIVNAQNATHCDLMEKLGEQKIDIVVHPKNAAMQLVHKIALRTGIEL